MSPVITNFYIRGQSNPLNLVNFNFYIRGQSNPLSMVNFNYYIRGQSNPFDYITCESPSVGLGQGISSLLEFTSVCPSLQEIKCIRLAGDKSSSFQVRHNRLKTLKSFRTLEAMLWKQTWCPGANIGTYFCGVAIDGDASNEE